MGCQDPMGLPPRAIDGGMLDTPNLQLVWSRVPWDSDLFGGPVLDISALHVRSSAASDEFCDLLRQLKAADARMVACRMSHERMRESMLLEDNGFRFIEMTIQPEFVDLQRCGPIAETELSVTAAEDRDMDELLSIAASAFYNERFHVDPRIGGAIGDKRYANWLKQSLDHPTQVLRVVHEGQRIVAFFVNENLPDGTCYWHLNAVAPALQGRGLGRRAWQAMLGEARRNGAQRVRSNIAVRNHRVLNLYASLGFRFHPPKMTFHWVSEG